MRQKEAPSGDIYYFCNAIVKFRMKQRRFTVWTCLVATVVLLVGCLQDKVGGVRIYSEPNAELYSISNQVSLFLFHASGPWKAESPVPWLQVLKETGPGGTDTLKVMTTQKNLTGQERRALVELVADGELTTVEVMQRDEYAEFDRDTIKLPAEGGMMDVDFRANERDSLQLYVTGSLVEFLEDTRKKDSTKASRAEDKEFKGTLNFLRVLPNTDTLARDGHFVLAIGIGNERYIGLDTLVFHQDGLTK